MMRMRFAARRTGSLALLGALLVAASLSAPSATAQEARPVRFWTSTQILRSPDARHRRKLIFTAPTPVATTLGGWSCRTELDAIDRYPEPPWFSQSARLVCTSVAGTVLAMVTCDLTAADEAKTSSFDLRDPAGHEVLLTVGCQNTRVVDE